MTERVELPLRDYFTLEPGTRLVLKDRQDIEVEVDELLLARLSRLAPAHRKQAWERGVALVFVDGNTHNVEGYTISKDSPT